MKQLILLCILTILSSILVAQNIESAGIPAWFIEEMQREAGTWVAENADYQSDHEPWDQYVIEWEWGIGKKSLVGKIYGLKGDQPSNVFWEYRMYWDPAREEAILLQFGPDGTVGTGAINRKTEETTEIIQRFTDPAGNSYEIGHRTRVLDSGRHRGASFIIDEEGNWNLNREYVWVRED